MMAGVGGLAVVLPGASMVLTSLMSTLSGGIHADNVTLRHFAALFAQQGDALSALATSLSLALALSDLVSHKTRIDSLFLDEGFGTLDSETLDTALDALDTLNASGKIIGVISHVEAMKERIPVQIKVKKINGLGYSRLDKAFAVE